MVVTSCYRNCSHRTVMLTLISNFTGALHWLTIPGPSDLAMSDVVTWCVGLTVWRVVWGLKVDWELLPVCPGSSLCLSCSHLTTIDITHHWWTVTAGPESSWRTFPCPGHLYSELYRSVSCHLLKGTWCKSLMNKSNNICTLLSTLKWLTTFSR